MQTGTGSLQITGAVGVTVWNRQNLFRTTDIYAIASLLWVSGNAYIAAGDLKV